MAIRFPKIFGEARRSKKNQAHLERRLAAENTIRAIRKNEPNLTTFQRPFDEIRGIVQHPGKGGRHFTAYRKELKRIQKANKAHKAVGTRFKRSI